MAFLTGLNDGLLANSGKMLRPALCLLTAGACGGINDESRNFAAAVEMLHNSTLLHDDVADESDTRRGTPTVMSLYGAIPAVLLGDFWLSRTVALVVDSPSRDRALPRFAKTLSDLSEGEMLQQEKAFKGDTAEEDYLRIIYCKTASLFELSCACGAGSAGAPQEQRDAASKYGKFLGMAFQIRDDILDYTGSDLGKPVGMDLKERKITLPLLGALKGASDSSEIRSMLASAGDHPENIAKINAFVNASGGIEYAQAVLRDYVSGAIDALSLFPPSEEKDFLEQVALINEIRSK